MKMPTNKTPFDEAVSRLFNISIFKDFSESNPEDVNMFRELYEKFFAETYDPGDLIVREGEEGNNLYILSSGAVKVFRNTQFGDEIAIADLDDSLNVCFGEAALIDADYRSATVRAVTKCRTLVLNGTDFVEFCTKYPNLGFHVYKQITKRMMQFIRRANNDIAMLYAALFREIEGTA